MGEIYLTVDPRLEAIKMCRRRFLRLWPERAPKPRICVRETYSEESFAWEADAYIVKIWIFYYSDGTVETLRGAVSI